MLGIPLIALGAVVAFTSFRQWRRNERAMRRRRAAPEVAHVAGPVHRDRRHRRDRHRPRRPRAEVSGPALGADVPPGSAGRDPGSPDRIPDPVEVAEAWDEGLAPERTQLAWGRTGLAVAAASACWPAGCGRWAAGSRSPPWRWSRGWPGVAARDAPVPRPPPAHGAPRPGRPEGVRAGHGGTLLLAVGASSSASSCRTDGGPAGSGGRLLQDVHAARRAESDDVGQADLRSLDLAAVRPRPAGGWPPPTRWRSRWRRSGGPWTRARRTR